MYPHLAAAADIASEGNWIKLLILVLCAVALYAFARWASGWGEQNAGLMPPQEDGGVPGRYPTVSVPDPQEVLAGFPHDPELGRVRITKFFFRKLEAIPGPPDPWTFADDLSLELYDPDSDHKWWQSYFVASPQGLARILRERNWSYVYASEMIVVPKYDLEEIRRAVVSRIVADNELFKPGKSTEESY